MQMKSDEIVSEFMVSTDNRLFVVVEGPSDIDFFDCFFDEIQIRFSFCGSCDEVIKTVRNAKKFSTNSKKIVGIVDLDYRFIFDKLPIDDCIFTTDLHDIESVMFQKGIVKKIMQDILDKNKARKKFGAHYLETIYELIVEYALETSFIRFEAEKIKRNTKKSISFKGISLSDHVTKDFSFNGENFYKKIKKKNKESLKKFKETYEKEKLLSLDKEVLKWTRGHDLVCLIEFLSKSKFSRKNKGKTENEVVTLLRNLYTQKEFDKQSVSIGVRQILKKVS